MRSTVLSRFAIATAVIAVGSAALAGTPASAATASGVTREMVLTAAAGLRVDPYHPDATTESAIRAVVDRTCGIAAGETYTLDSSHLTPAGSADGFVTIASITDAHDEAARDCIVGATAITVPDFTLSGSATLTVGILQSGAPEGQAPTPRFASGPLSGEVVVTGPVIVGPSEGYSGITLRSSGRASKTTTTFTSTRVKDPKTKAQKKKAQKRYVKKLKAAKKAYKAAIKKAGRSKVKQASAKRSYASRKKSAKKVYAVQIADYKIVSKHTRTVDSRPFSMSIPIY